MYLLITTGTTNKKGLYQLAEIFFLCYEVTLSFLFKYPQVCY